MTYTVAVPGAAARKAAVGALAGAVLSAGAVGAAAVPAWAGAIPARGYVATWYFNANDEMPEVKVNISRQGTFAFSYRPQECSAGSFRISGAFRAGLTTVDGTRGQLLTFAAAGSCSGPGGHMTWKNAKGAAVGYGAGARWPNSRYVYGQMTQVATAPGVSGSLQIDWGMSAIPPT
ncbi:MAG TPA: hypothetical protein VFN61_16565 [Acidimicrobiales bacterium]|nr:hypothetical protein [Acidimicrobiales bacterium]